jgi:hypothetical protein
MSVAPNKQDANGICGNRLLLYQFARKSSRGSVGLTGNQNPCPVLRGTQIDLDQPTLFPTQIDGIREWQQERAEDTLVSDTTCNGPLAAGD